MIGKGSRVQLKVASKNKIVFFALAEIISYNPDTIGVKYVSKASENKETHEYEPEFKTEVFSASKIMEMRELL